MVNSLICYKDTHAFFDKHYDEIEEMRYEYFNQGIEIQIPSEGDLKNFLAWPGFEEKASKDQ